MLTTAVVTVSNYGAAGATKLIPYLYSDPYSS